eukprot:24722-Chlamydomonas_euryale.AAC.5
MGRGRMGGKGGAGACKQVRQTFTWLTLILVVSIIAAVVDSGHRLMCRAIESWKVTRSGGSVRAFEPWRVTCWGLRMC